MVSAGWKWALGLGALTAGMIWVRHAATEIAKGAAGAFKEPPPKAPPPVTPLPAPQDIPQAGTPIPAPLSGSPNKPTLSFGQSLDPNVLVPPESQLQLGNTYNGDDAPYYLVLYTSRVLPSGGWGPWNDPMYFRGHDTGSKVFSSPDDDMVAYLDALAVTNQSEGFWLAFAVPVLGEDAAGNPTSVGNAGPWMSGRFGNLQGLNSDPNLSAVISLLGLPNSGKVTEYVQLPYGSPPMSGERAIA